MKRRLHLALALIPVLLVFMPAQAGADPQFASLAFNDSAHVVTTVACNWTLLVNEPDVAGQPVIGMATGTAGVLRVTYPAFCGRIQADALVGPPQRKEVGYRHEINTCDCPTPPASTWPSVLEGAPPVHAHSPQGIYLGEVNDKWTLYATHRGGSGQVFGGTVTTDGTFAQLESIKFEGHDRVTQVAPDEVQFRFVNRGYLDGISFVVGCASHLTLDSVVNGSPAETSQIYLGPTLTHSTSNPMTFTRS
jgi:hypothetical protein